MAKSARKAPTVQASAPAEGGRPVKPPQKGKPGRRTEKAKPSSKQSHVIAMLQAPSGATIAAMMKATDWQQHSVRGFLAGVVRKRLKLMLGSRKVDGERVYHIAAVRKSSSARSKGVLA